MTITPYESMEDAVLDRFFELNKHIEGVKRSIRIAPDEPVGKRDCPYVYSLVGDIQQPTSIGTGSVDVVRQFGHRLMIMPLTKGLNDAEEGAEANVRAMPFFSRWIFFYGERPLLQHDGVEGDPSNVGLPPLRGCKLVSMTGTGLTTRLGADGEIYAAIEFLFVVSMSRNIKTVSSPYPTI